MVSSLEPAILFRPLGGFNDTLCGLWRCAEYARRFKRLLIIDTYFSGLMADFGDFFEVNLEGVRVELAPRQDDLLAYVEANSVRWPSDSPISAREFLDREEYSGALDNREPIRQKFSTSTVYPERLLIHHSSGGGQASHKVLSEIRVRDDIKQQLRSFANTLPSRYFAIHVRHSDYKTEYRAFLRAAAKLSRSQNLSIFVGTDNSSVFDFAARILPANRLLLPRSSTAVKPGLALHNRSSYLSDNERRDATVDMLATLFALAGSSRLTFPPVYKTEEKDKIMISGFSQLADFLHRNDVAFESFFGLVRPASRDHNAERSFAVVMTKAKMARKVLSGRLKRRLSDRLGKATSFLRTGGNRQQ